MLTAHEEIAKYMSRYGDPILVVATHPIGKEHLKSKTCGGGDVAAYLYRALIVSIFDSKFNSSKCCHN